MKASKLKKNATLIEIFFAKNDHPILMIVLSEIIRDFPIWLAHSIQLLNYKLNELYFIYLSECNLWNLIVQSRFIRKGIITKLETLNLFRVNKS